MLKPMTLQVANVTFNDFKSIPIPLVALGTN